MSDDRMDWYFIRHGEIDSNRRKVYSGRSEECLNATGRAQVKSTCNEISNLNIDAIYSSPLNRTRQTAEIVADQLRWTNPLHVDECFNELKMGPWEGMPEEEVAKQFPEEWAIWNTSPESLSISGRETLQELQTRVVQGMRHIDKRNDYTSVLVVTHVAVIRVVTLFARDISLNLYKSVDVENAKVFRFRFNL
jgi:broad specificity phosphatase PhoE